MKLISEDQIKAFYRIDNSVKSKVKEIEKKGENVALSASQLIPIFIRVLDSQGDLTLEQKVKVMFKVYTERMKIQDHLSVAYLIKATDSYFKDSVISILESVDAKWKLSENKSMFYESLERDYGNTGQHAVILSAIALYTFLTRNIEKN